MSIFGKLLAILNVLAAIGFIALAVYDYQARRQWVYAAFLHERVIYGVPVNDTELDKDGNRLVDDMTPKTVQTLLGAGGSVKTQEAEVNDVKNKLQNKINDSSVAVKYIDGSDLGQAALVAPHQKLAYVLLPLADSVQDREDLRNTMFNVSAAGQPLDDQEKAKQAEALQARFDQAFTQAISGHAGGQKINLEERKQAIAHLLFCVRDRFEEPPAAGQTANPWEAPSFTRLKGVVGLTALIHEIDSQYALLSKEALDLASHRQRDLDHFVDSQRKLIGQAKTLAEQRREQANVLAQQEAERDKQLRLVKARQAEVEDLTKQLQDSREYTAGRLKIQTELEAVLYKTIQDLRNLQQKNLDLEKRIQELEKAKSK